MSWRWSRIVEFVATIAAVTQGTSGEVAAAGETSGIIHPLRPRLSGSGSEMNGVSCLSWRLGVEAHNIIDWPTIPQSCKNYMGNYMVGRQYRQDSKVVVDEAIHYLHSLLNHSSSSSSSHANDVWIFDVDETTLSNLPYYAHHGFGAEPYNSTSFNEWVSKARAPALPESLRLYKELLSLRIKIVFLTGRRQRQTANTSANLKKAGYHTWEKLILKGDSYSATAMAYKSSERGKLEEESGYRIVGNMGDQWSDLLGTHVGLRTFKLPDPLYFVA